MISEKQQTDISEELFVQNEYNLDLRDFALAVGKAMNKSADFRKLIKKEALLKFDGDYDVLLKNIADKPVAQYGAEGQLRNDGNYTVKDLLEDSYATSTASSLRASSESVISTLTAKYPNLQVSVPVNAENWDETTTTPAVAFVPLEIQDGVTKSIPAYNPNGSLTVLDAVNPPVEAVIVISQNERLYKPLDPSWPCRPYYPIDNMKTSFTEGDTIAPSAPTALTANQTSDGIALSWNQATGIHVIGYYIYRKSTNDANFSIIGISNGYINSVYCDKNTQAGITYYYKVSSYNDFDESLFSNTVSITGIKPSAPATFEVRQYSNKQVELRWTTPDVINFQKLQLYKLIAGASNGYQLTKEFSVNDHDYFDNVTSGQRLQYRLQTVAATGISNPKYDYIQVPYRNPSVPSSLKIKSIKCNDKLEPWYRGSPEFQIKIFGVDNSFKTTEIQSIYVNFNGDGLGAWSRTQAQDILIVDWQPDTWYQMFTFYIVEDDGGNREATVSASANYKASEDLTVTSGGSLKTTVKKGEEVGYGFISYFDPIDKVVSFTNSVGYDFYMTMGN
jgi:hypothetical protein